MEYLLQLSEYELNFNTHFLIFYITLYDYINLNIYMEAIKSILYLPIFIFLYLILLNFIALSTQP